MANTSRHRERNRLELKRKESPRYEHLICRSQGACRKEGLFLLVMGGRWEFYDATRGGLVLTWFEDSGRWTTPAGTDGRVRHPFAALRVAAKLYNARKRSATMPTY